jgi:ABC-type Fe3+-hydroxamate transport system substrate-binding protein
VEVEDARGRTLRFDRSPRRIVSLVPSHTETLFAIGAGERVVGATEYCVHPAEALAAVPRVGGTKNPDLSRVLELDPELVIVNREENRARDVERLEAAGVPVLVTYARTVERAALEIAQLGEVAEAAPQAAHIVDEIRAALAAVGSSVASEGTRPRVVGLVWKDPYMGIGADTYAADLIACAGGDIATPEGATRYPRLDRAALEAAAPDVLLLPTEPYAFAEADRVELLELDCPASRTGRVHVVEGELLSWYGPRIPRALRVFGELFARV